MATEFLFWFSANGAGKRGVIAPFIYIRNKPHNRRNNAISGVL
nr:MAG TPA: hypothetical protein [Caudoviricetes sp.]